MTKIFLSLNIYENILNKIVHMKLSLSIKTKNILLIVIFLSICFICDAIFFEIVREYIFCNSKYTLGYYLYQMHEHYKFLYNNQNTITYILGCVYFLFFRTYVFQKWISIVENKCQGLFLHDFLKELRENKQILLYANIIFLLLTIVMYHFYCLYIKTSPFLSFIFFFPFHYLILYIRWVIKDKNYKNKQIRTKKYPIIQYINFFVMSNIQVILFSSFCILIDLFTTEDYIQKIICWILFWLIVLYIVYFVLFYIKYNIKFFTKFSLIFFFLFTLIFYDIIYHTKFINNTISCIFALTYYSISFLCVIASILPNQVAKLIVNDK